MTTAIDGGFRFEGVEPDEDLRAEAHRVFDEIAGLAPYGANFDACITEWERGYVVDLLISSCEGRFKARVRAEDLPSALLLMEHTMRDKFESWRRTRFLPPAAGWDTRKVAA